eukprot:6063809-Amphidinium_carterae.1
MQTPGQAGGRKIGFRDGVAVVGSRKRSCYVGFPARSRAGGCFTGQLWRQVEVETGRLCNEGLGELPQPIE